MSTDVDVRRRVDVYVDPMDPWSFLVSRWVENAEKVRPVDVHLHLMSVSLLNAGRDVPERYADDPEGYRERMRTAWGPVRVGTAVLAGQGEDTLRAFYMAVARRIHQNGRRDYAVAVDEALVEIGLPAELARAADTDEWDELLTESHRAGVDPVGDDVGSPIVHLAGSAFFGPVISRAPEGEKAGLLLDALAGMAEFPDFWELKRTRTVEPDLS